MIAAAWNHFPTFEALCRAADTLPRPLYLAVCLPDRQMPQFRPPPASGMHQRLSDGISAALACLQFDCIHAVQHILPDVHLWLVPPAAAPVLQQHFPVPLVWQGEAVPQLDPEPEKPWFVPSENKTPPQRVIVVGAGIAGAATAYHLATQGVEVCVIDAAQPAEAASGNRQGLLYAKISPHPTAQTLLLLAGYGHTRRLLETLLPEQNSWGGGGVLHLNFDETERRRNRHLAQQHHHAHLYRAVSAGEASALAGIEMFSDGLYWPQGVWLNPRALVLRLLDHPLIECRFDSPLTAAYHDGRRWIARTARQTHEGSHIVFCAGAGSPKLPLADAACLPYRLVRGQTSNVRASALSQRLRCAVSGKSYIAPAWQGQHCFGATFVPNCEDTGLKPEEADANRAALAALNPPLAASLFSDGISGLSAAESGHAALRCDSADHLPIAGALGDAAAMRRVYAKLADDLKYPVDTPCPYLPDAYANTAHGTRGLATAPVCAAAVAAEICGLPHPFSPALRRALAPNRYIIRAIGKPPQQKPAP